MTEFMHPRRLQLLTRAILAIVQAARTAMTAQNTKKGHPLRTGQLLLHRLDQLDVNTFPFTIVY